MRFYRPRPVPPTVLGPWLHFAWALLRAAPLPFLLSACLAPVLTRLLLTIPGIAEAISTLPAALGLALLLVVHGLPLCLSVCLACAVARAARHHRIHRLRELLSRHTLRVLLPLGGFLAALLLQGGIVVFLLVERMQQGLPGAAGASSFLSAPTLLGTELILEGLLLLLLAAFFAPFTVPLALFREHPLLLCWRLSYHATRLNPWLWPYLGLAGTCLVGAGHLQTPGIALAVQILALPIPALLGTLLYIAWAEIFAFGMEERDPDRRDDAAPFLGP
jgi:hypothetical protein